MSQKTKSINYMFTKPGNFLLFLLHSKATLRNSWHSLTIISRLIFLPFCKKDYVILLAEKKSHFQNSKHVGIKWVTYRTLTVKTANCIVAFSSVAPRILSNNLVSNSVWCPYSHDEATLRLPDFRIGTPWDLVATSMTATKLCLQEPLDPSTRFPNMMWKKLPSTPHHNARCAQKRSGNLKIKRGNHYKEVLCR